LITLFLENGNCKSFCPELLFEEEFSFFDGGRCRIAADPSHLLEASDRLPFVGRDWRRRRAVEGRGYNADGDPLRGQSTRSAVQDSAGMRQTGTGSQVSSTATNPPQPPITHVHRIAPIMTLASPTLPSTANNLNPFKNTRAMPTNTGGNILTYQ